MKIDELPMRIAIGQTNQLTPEIIEFAHQIADQVLSQGPLVSCLLVFL